WRSIKSESTPAARVLSKRSGREKGTKSSERAVRDMGCSWCRELQIRGVEIRPDGDDRAADPPWQIPGGICHVGRACEGAVWSNLDATYLQLTTLARERRVLLAPAIRFRATMRPDVRPDVKPDVKPPM